MNYLSKVVAAALVAVGATVTNAAPIAYEGALTLPLTTVTGSVTGHGYVDLTASGVDFWSFSGIAGQRVLLRGTRVDAALDPILDLYFGVTSADSSLFQTGQSWGGLTFLTSSDDVTTPPSGPFGDPLLSNFLLPSTGQYTVALGGAGSDGDGPYRYSLTLQAVQAVPEPETWALLFAGAGFIGVLQRRRQKQAAARS